MFAEVTVQIETFVVVMHVVVILVDIEMCVEVR